jgi:hypothetical protein
MMSYNATDTHCTNGYSGNEVAVQPFRVISGKPVDCGRSLSAKNLGIGCPRILLTKWEKVDQVLADLTPRGDDVFA